MEVIVFVLVNGLVMGGLYALLAVGFSLVFGIARIPNLFYTATYMVGAYVAWFSLTQVGMPYPAAIALCIFISLLIGLIAHRFIVARVYNIELAIVAVTLGAAFAVQEIVESLFGKRYYMVPPFVEGSATVAGTPVLYQRLIMIAICALILIVVWQWLTRAKLGKAIRGYSQDKEIINLAGVDPQRIGLIVTGISCIMAGVAAAVAAPILTVSSTMWMPPLLIVLVAVIIGGFGNLKGAIVAAFILGFAEVILITIFPAASYFRTAIVMVIMLVVLVTKPEGLFGTVFEEERL